MKGSVIIEIESTKGFFYDFFNTFAIYDAQLFFAQEESKESLTVAINVATVYKK